MQDLIPNGPSGGALAAMTGIGGTLKRWVVDLFVRAISSISREEDRIEAIGWLVSSREIVGSKSDAKSKYAALYQNMNTGKAVRVVVSSVAETVRNYKNSTLPISVKIALPVTLLTVPFAGGHAAGVAAFGGAIGVPVLLLIFLGTTGISAIIEACASNVDARAYVRIILDQILRDEALRQMRADMKSGKQGPPERPVPTVMPDGDNARRQMLLNMDPYAFEHHVMKFFEVPALHNVYVTKRSGDGGVDGFAEHTNGLIVVQCKRNALTNLVGSPDVRDFGGAIVQHNAWRGYFVTTSGFTMQAADSLPQFEKIVPIDMEQLVEWHREPPSFLH